MTPAQAIAQLDRQIAQHGESVTLRRVGSPDDTTLAAQAFVRRLEVDPLVPGVDAAQGGTMVILSPTALGAFGAPVRHDQADIAGRRVTIEEVEEVRMGSSVIRYNLMVKG